MEAMPNKRYQLAQEEGALTRKRQENLKAHPMGNREAVRIPCEVHTVASDGPHGFEVGLQSTA